MFVVVMTLARNHEMTFLIVIIDSVEDKSFNLVEDSKEIEVDLAAAQNRQGGLIETVRNLFRS